MSPGDRVTDLLGYVICPANRPATPLECWVELIDPANVALHELAVVQGDDQLLLGSIAELQLTEEREEDGSVCSESVIARLSILSSSDERMRLPQGRLVRRPRPAEVSDLLCEARQIPPQHRIPIGVVELTTGFAPVFIDARRLVGPLATSAVYTGASGSQKTTGAILLLHGLRRVRHDAIIVITNVKGLDLLCLDAAREKWAGRLGLRQLEPRDRAMYRAMGYARPPVFDDLTVWVPDNAEPPLRSARPATFPRTEPFRLGPEVVLRIASLSGDEHEPRAGSPTIAQCIAAAAEDYLHRGCTVWDVIDGLSAVLAGMGSERARYRNQFQLSTVAAAIRQLKSTLHALGAIVTAVGEPSGFPVERLANGGTWVVDLASLPHAAQEACLDELITALIAAKDQAIIPPERPLILAVDEEQSWHKDGFVSRHLARIVRDRRGHGFALLAITQQLSRIALGLADNASIFSLGITGSRELAEHCYGHLPPHVRVLLGRLKPGERVLHTSVTRPVQIATPYPSFLIGEEPRTLIHYQAGHARISGQPVVGIRGGVEHDRTGPA